MTTGVTFSHRADAAPPAPFSVPPRILIRVSKEPGARELYAQLGTAELGAADVERAAVELDRLAHDGEADALPRHGFVGALAALEQRPSFLGGHAAAVVADRNDEPLP